MNPRFSRASLAIGSAAAVGCIAWILLSPYAFPVCAARVFLGIPCPSCGLTRALHQAAHGEWAAASQLHPLWWSVPPLVLLTLALQAKGRDRVARSLAAGVLALLVGVWVARFAGAFGGPVPV